MGEQSYQAERAVADLRAAGLLTGIVVAGPRGARYHPADDLPSRIVGGFAGAGLDSRALESGQLFIALKGEKADARDFIPSVIRDGHWVLADCRDREPGLDMWGDGPMPTGVGIMLTGEPVAALSCLAAAWRGRLDLQVVGVTGTNGKTTTKDLLSSLLRGAGATWATAGNFNNRLGLPLTLLGLTGGHRFAVVEMGASSVGDIARLSALARPRVGVITNAAPAHLAEFRSLEEIIQGKGELLDALPSDGVAILNADSPGFESWRACARCPVVSCGRRDADHIWRWRPDGVGGRPEIEMDGRAWPVPLPGEHNGANLAAALLAAQACGLTVEEITAGLSGFSGSPHRGVLLDVGGRTVLDDCYNANPVSMAAAGRSVGRLPGNGRVVAVLGAMAELGPDSDHIHELTGRDLAQGPVELLIVVGKNARHLGVGFDAGGGVSHYCANLEEAAGLAALHTHAGDRLLIKGSRSAAMEDILPLLEEAFRKN